MTIIFSNSSLQIWSQIWGNFVGTLLYVFVVLFSFCVSHYYRKSFFTKLWNKANSRALIANMRIIFQNCFLKHKNKALLVPKLRILSFSRKFAIRKIGGHWLQYNNSFSTFQSKDPYRDLLVPSSFFKFIVSQTRWSWLKIW